MARLRSSEIVAAQLSGRLGQAFPPLAALQVCHVAEMTGTLHARSGARFVDVYFRGGEVVAALSPDREGLDALVDFGRWADGCFDFVCGKPPKAIRLRKPFAGLMLGICQKLDESRRRAS